MMQENHKFESQRKILTYKKNLKICALIVMVSYLFLLAGVICDLYKI